ncbi:unnamed protein product [Heligmosomoides polygyrus]|uniref:Secreted protein n=1 Tax=Heligmosomoides polygyrus TaxID=6339 RepID=A0A183F7H6_HELPZ|nr:unnamed protein product [Heligmosomoides polygyrus]
MNSFVSLCFLLVVCFAVTESRRQRTTGSERLGGASLSFSYSAVRPAKRNRMCLINAGLSQGCDLSDIIMAKQQASKFMSFAGPGRR